MDNYHNFILKVIKQLNYSKTLKSIFSKLDFLIWSTLILVVPITTTNVPNFQEIDW